MGEIIMTTKYTNTMSESQSIVKHEGNMLSVFGNASDFENAQRMAKAIGASSIIPTSYQNNIPNILVAMDMALRTGEGISMVMQNLNIIQGRPSWGSSYIIGKINSCGRFSPLRFKMEDLGQKDVQYSYWVGSKQENNRRKEAKVIRVQNLSCVAWTKDATGDVLEGPRVTIEMAVYEGWYTKSDSKWPTMPDLMLRYRAAAFFGRLYCPDILQGMQTSEEIQDVEHEVVSTTKRTIADINSQIQSNTPPPQTDNTQYEDGVVIDDEDGEII